MVSDGPAQLLILGAAKSGTTTLYELFQRHRDIFISTPKEPRLILAQLFALS